MAKKDKLINIKISAKALDKIALPRFLQYQEFAKRLLESRKRRIESGKATDGTSIPDGNLKTLPKKEPLKPKESKGETKKNQGALPLSLIQTFRKLGGYFKSLGSGDWKGGSPILYGKDAGEKAGQQWGWHWETAESFKNANYGQSPAIKTGKTIEEKRFAIKATKKGAKVSYGFKGPNLNGKSLISLLISERERKAEAERKGEQPNPVKGSLKMALINARNRLGNVGKGANVNFLDPSDKELADALAVFSKHFEDEIKKIPVKIMVKGE